MDELYQCLKDHVTSIGGHRDLYFGYRFGIALHWDTPGWGRHAQLQIIGPKGAIASPGHYTSSHFKRPLLQLHEDMERYLKELGLERLAHREIADKIRLRQQHRQEHEPAKLQRRSQPG